MSTMPPDVEAEIAAMRIRTAPKNKGPAVVDPPIPVEAPKPEEQNA